MSPLWVLPLCVLGAGTAVVAVAARRLADEVAALVPALAALDDLAGRARSLRIDVDAARARGGAVPDRLRAVRAAARRGRADR